MALWFPTSFLIPFWKFLIKGKGFPIPFVNGINFLNQLARFNISRALFPFLVPFLWLKIPFLKLRRFGPFFNQFLFKNFRKGIFGIFGGNFLPYLGGKLGYYEGWARCTSRRRYWQKPLGLEGYLLKFLLFLLSLGTLIFVGPLGVLNFLYTPFLILNLLGPLNSPIFPSSFPTSSKILPTA